MRPQMNFSHIISDLFDLRKYECIVYACLLGENQSCNCVDIELSICQHFFFHIISSIQGVSVNFRSLSHLRSGLVVEIFLISCSLKKHDSQLPFPLQRHYNFLIDLILCFSHILTDATGDAFQKNPFIFLHDTSPNLALKTFSFNLILDYVLCKTLSHVLLNYLVGTDGITGSYLEPCQRCKIERFCENS